MCIVAISSFSICAGLVVLGTSNALVGGSVTIENYNNVKIGMTHQDVEGILGRPTVDNRGVGLETSLWKKNGKTLVQILFFNNEVVDKSAPGLH